MRRKFSDIGLRRRRRGFGLRPAGPTAPLAELVPGSSDGEVQLTYSPPESFGDGPVRGDGDGIITGYDAWIGIGGGAPVAYDATAPRTIVSTGHAPGSPVTAIVRARGYDNRAGMLWFGATIAPGSSQGVFVPGVFAPGVFV